MKVSRSSLRGSALLVLLALNGCGGSGEEEEEFEFGKADMESALHGTWVGTWGPADGSETTPFELVIHAPSEPGTRMACGTRTIAESEPGLSPQCGTVTQLGVSGTATVADSEVGPVELDGYASTFSRIFNHAELELSRESAPFRLVASWDEEEGFTHCAAFAPDGAALASCTLDERR